MSETVAYPCEYCGTLTEWLELNTYRFFCKIDEPVVKNTATLRKVQRSMHCPIDGDQRCHILGLNAVKLILNAYGEQCLRIEEETLKELVIAVNARDNLYCCSAEQNVKDKYTEEAFLDYFLYHKTSYETLTEEVLYLYDTLRRILSSIEERSASPVLERILADFAVLAPPVKRIKT